MDLGVSFKQSNLIHGVECKRYRASDFLRPKFGSRISVFGCEKRGNVQPVAIMYISRNVRRNGGVSRCTMSSVPCIRSSLMIKPMVCGSELGRSSLKWTVRCQGSDSVAYIDGDGPSVEVGKELEDGLAVESKIVEGEKSDKEGEERVSVEELKEMLQKASRELEVARLNSIMYEKKAQNFSEASIALKDQAENARDAVESAFKMVEEVVTQELGAKEAVQKATMALSLAEARLQVALESVEAARRKSVNGEASLENKSENDTQEEVADLLRDEEEGLQFAQAEIVECKLNLENCEAELTRLQRKKEELQIEVDRLNEFAELAQANALKAEEDVTSIMHLAEQAVAFEIEAAQRVDDAETALQRAKKLLSLSEANVTESASLTEDVDDQEEVPVEGPFCYLDRKMDYVTESASLASKSDTSSDKINQGEDVSAVSDDSSDKENGKLGVEATKDAEIEVEKGKSSVQSKKADAQKDGSRDSSPSSTPKSSVKKSSRFFSASFFSFAADGEEFTPASVFHDAIHSAKKQLPKLIVGLLLLGAGVTYYSNRGEKAGLLLQQPDAITTSVEEIQSNAKPLIRQIRKLPKTLKMLIEKIPHQEINEEEASLLDVVWLLLASVIFVPIFQKLPGGSPVLGYLAAGILIGPYGFSIIRYVHGTKAIAEFGVVFLLFNIGLELSVERLSSMKKYVFGLGSAQVLSTAAAIGFIVHFIARQAGPAAIVIGNGLALSSTAVVLQVLQERGESTSRHGRAAFSVLLFQDLAVVVLLILIPLISPNSSKGGVGFQAIAEALGLAAVKAIVAITAIIAGGRLLLRPIYKQIAENQNAEIFSANTLLVILGTSLLTARAGLSMALGAFLAGLLLAETEFSLQVESDIAPYRGLLLGLFFMTVGMSIDPKLFISNFPTVMGTLGLLIVGKTALVTLVGRFFGVSTISAVRTGLLLAPGGEFAFVAFGEAVNQGIMSSQLSSLLFLVVGLSMALTPWLAAGGQVLASRFEQHDVRSLLPVESETDDLQDHIIICGFGRVGQIIAQLLSERLIPFVALDVRSDRVAVGRALDLPVYFGDAGSREVLHKVGAHRACAAAVTLDTPGANYRTVWALSKHFPNIKTFVRAHDVDHGLNLEKAGATAVVPETLEPSLQLAAAVLAQAKLPTAEIAATINEFRSRHLSELTELCEASGSSLGYGFSRVMSKPKSQPSESLDDNQIGEGTLAI
ncbi:K(+) efflux antiporter 2, chloroplastic-like [Silene latifolia]|uniref:K(+) efflux antiporter 2, chloroplastic-like n=1 Tax=Silene latifolia TaxID=37657 RepID=UPI003D7782C8